MRARQNPHPIHDVFIEGLVDYSPKDSSELMERPFCSLATRKRIQPLIYHSPDGKVWVRILPHPEFGMATIWDFDILIYLITRVMQQREPGSNRLDGLVRCTPHQILKAVGRGTSGREYIGLTDALNRLRNTAVETNIRATKKLEVVRFSWISEFKGTGTDPDSQLSSLSIRLPDWLLEGIQQGHVLTLDRSYFNLRGGLEKAVYRIARKHAGSQPHGFTIRLSVLREKLGSDMQEKHFRGAIKKLVASQSLPRYAIAFTQTATGEEAVHFVDRSFEDVEKAQKRRVQSVKKGRDPARMAWIDAGQDPREFEERYETWCEAGHEPADFPRSITNPRLL